MLGDRLRVLRAIKQMTIAETAKALDVSRSTYAGYETGDRNPPIQNLIKLAKFHQVSTDYLLGLSDDPNVKKIDSNIAEYFKKDRLDWHGIPIEKDELEPIIQILQLIAKNKQT